MDTRVEKALADIIMSYGVEVIQNPRQVEGLLRDFCGDLKREINLLVFALKEGVPSDLLKEKDQVQVELLTNRLVKRLVDHLALEESAARWAISSWKTALQDDSKEKSQEVEDKSFEPEGVLELNLTGQKVIPRENLNVNSEPQKKPEQRQTSKKKGASPRNAETLKALEAQLSEQLKAKKWEEVKRISQEILDQDPDNQLAIKAQKTAMGIAYNVETWKKKIKSNTTWWGKVKIVRGWLACDPNSEDAKTILNENLSLAPSLEEIKKEIEEAYQKAKWAQVILFVTQWLALDPNSNHARNYLRKAKKEDKVVKAARKMEEARKLSTGKTGKPLGNNHQPQNESIYIGNLPFTMSDTELRQLAAQIGNGKHIQDAYIIKDQSSGKSRGFGFIVLSNVKSNSLLIDQYVQQLNGKVFKGRALQARGAYPKSFS